MTHWGPIEPSWCPDCEWKISLINSLNECQVHPAEERDTEIWAEIDGEIDSYKMLVPIDSNMCLSLAPHIGSECIESYWVEVKEYTGGTIGWHVSNGIYGLFDLPDLGLSIVPLIYFASRNDALNYVEGAALMQNAQSSSSINE